MTPDSSSTNVCQEKAGFLFKHACGLFADQVCQQCHKPVCHRHLRSMDDKLVCISCSKGVEEEGITLRGRSGRRRYDDPYDYADYHYPGYGRYQNGSWGYLLLHNFLGRDKNDLTEADAQSLALEGDEAFETDMGES